MKFSFCFDCRAVFGRGDDSSQIELLTCLLQCFVMGLLVLWEWKVLLVVVLDCSKRFMVGSSLEGFWFEIYVKLFFFIQCHCDLS